MSNGDYSLRGKRVWVAGHRGMVGSAIVRRLEQENCEVFIADRQTADLRRQESTEAFIARTKPQAVFLAAARVGGILANSTYPVDFLYDNLMIATNVIEASWRGSVEKLCFLGSSCIYPKHAPQPISEDALLTGPLEPTNQWYAVAKIVGIKLCEAYREQHGADFISAMPTNLYGPGDKFDLQTSHVMPALIRKAHEAKLANQSRIEVWGTGTPRREFLHVDDCADAVIHLMQHYSGSNHINVGSGDDLTIRELTEMVCRIVGFAGTIAYDQSKPDGTPRKLIDSGRIQETGWRPRITLEQGIRLTYEWFLTQTTNLSR